MSFQVPLAGQSINTATIGIETNISSSSASIGNLSVVNATIGQLSTTIFNPASVTTASLDATSGVIDSLVVNNVMDFLNVTEINACRKNVCNISTLNLSASQITCDNLQPLLTAGTNISILDGVISAVNEALLPADATFDSVTSDIVNALYIDADNVSIDNLSIDQKLSVAGNVNISGTLSASNLSTGSLKFGSGLLYDQFDSELEVEVNQFIQEGSNLPVTSWAVYKAIDNQFSNIQAQTCYRLYETDFKLDNSQVGATQDVIIFYTDYFPQYEESKIIVEFCYSYSVAGSGTDGITTYIQIGRNNNSNQEIIQMLFQDWSNAGGGGTRSGASSSIMGMYVNEDNIGKYHRIKMRVDNNSDDVWQLDSTSYPVVKITEFIPIAGISNPNIRLGNGNISCGNISCNSLTITDITIDNVITNYNVNVGGDMITVGFPISGAIASKSYVRLAGANTVLNYGDLSWDGTTFNLSTRQANKNFKVSFAQQDYFEVNSNNTSCRSLYVNGNISMSGTLTIGGALSFTNAIIQNSLLVNGLITGSSAEFSDDVTFDDNVSMHKRLNVSNVSVTQGLTVYGNISTRGNISANYIYAPNLSTASLKAGTNITIVNGFINAYVEGGTLVDCGSLQVDTDANIFGILNVSKTSTFVESLNVCNIIYAGKTGQHDGSVVVYSQSIGNNWATKYDGTVLNMSATGTTSQVNTWLGSDKILSITPTGVNICGTLKADSIDADYTNFSTVNLSVQNATVENTSGINASFNQLSSSIMDVTQLNGTNGHFTSSLTAANISTGSLVFGSGLNFFLGELSVDFTTSETQVADFQNALAQEVETNTLNAGFGTINVLTVTTFMNTSEINASVINCSDIDSNSGTIDVLDCTNISTDVLDVNTSINTRHLNCSNLSVQNISSTRANFTTDIITPKVTTEALNTSSTMMFNILNAPSMELSDSLYLYTDLRGTNLYSTENICGNNGSFKNLSTVSLTATSIVAPNVQPTLIAGTGVNFVGNTINATGTTYTAGNNIQIVSEVISTSTNINVSNLSSVNLVVNTSISTRHVNCSTLTLTDSTGAGGLKVTGTAYIDAIITYYPCQFQTNEISVGKLNGTGTQSVINFFALTTPNTLHGRIGIDSDSALRLSVLDYGQFVAKINMQIKNVSYLTMENNSTRFQRAVIFQNDVTASKITSTNICNTNLSTTNCTITTLRGTTLNGTTINASNLNISTKLSVTNISATNGSFTSLTASNLQEKIIAGTNITINGNTINSIGTTYVAGTGINISGDIITATGAIFSAGENIQLTSDVISTLPDINVSSLYSSENICGNNVSFTNLSCVNITATSITASNVQPLITDGSLTIANTSGLQTALNGKQDFILDGGLAMIKVNGLTSALFGKQPTINTSSLVISNTSGLQAALNGKQPTINTSSLVISNTSGLQEALNGKQSTLIAGTNISIVGNTISSLSGTNLTAGNNLEIVAGVISTSTNINVSNLSSVNLVVNTSISTRHVNCSTLTLTDSTGAGGLKVTGTAYIDAIITYYPCQFQTNEISVGKINGTGTQSVVNFFALTTPNTLHGRIGIDSDSALRLSVLDYGQISAKVNIQIKNVSYLTMENNSTRFQRNVIFGNDVTATKITCTNICNTNLTSTKITCTNISNTNLSTTNCTITTLRGTTLNGTTINASNLNISTKLTTTNISATNITATSITAPNVQPTLTAGTNISILGNVISSTGGGTTLTEGNNIQIVGDVISTTASLNSSNISTINSSFTNLTCSGNISFSIGNYLFRNPLDGILNVCSTTVSTDLIGPLRTTFNASLLQAKKLNVSNISFVAGLGGGFLDMGDLGMITKAFSVTSATLNSSTLNASNITVNTKVTTTNLSVTTATINTSLSANYIYTNTMTVGGLLTTGFFESEDFFTGDLTSSGIIFGNEIRATIVKSATVNGTTMNCSNINISTNLTTTNISATNITATSIVAPNVQPTLTTSNNIQIIADTISTTAVINSTTHNVSTINCSNITVNTKVNTTNLSTTNLSATTGSFSGALTIGGYLTLNTQPRFVAYYNNSPTILTISSGSKIPYNREVYDVGNGYNTGTYVYTVPVAGLYFFSLTVVSAPNDDGLIAIKENNVIVARSKTSNTGQAYKTIHCITYLNLVAGDLIHAECVGNTVRCLRDTALPQGVAQFCGMRVA